MYHTAASNHLQFFKKNSIYYYFATKPGKVYFLLFKIRLVLKHIIADRGAAARGWVTGT